MAHLIPMPILFLRNSTSWRTTSATWPRPTETGGSDLLCFNRLNSATAKAARGERRTGVGMVEQDGDGETDAMLTGETMLVRIEIGNGETSNPGFRNGRDGE